MTLATVADYVQEARVLLQDVTEPFRYSTDSIVAELNLGVLETRKMRPDLFIAYYRTEYPSFTAAALTDPVPLDLVYRNALVYYIVGKCTLRDEEENEDARAGKFLAKHARQLLTVEG